MKTLDLSFSDDAHQNLQPLENASMMVRLPEIWVERLHVFATAALCTTTMLLCFLSMGSFGMGLALSMGFLCLLALMASGRVRIVLGDLYMQFQYREKFALFLLHIGVLVLPKFLFGLGPWTLNFAILLIFLCLQGVNSLFFARINFLCLLLVFWHSGFASLKPEGAHLAMWISLWLLSVRFSYIRFRLEQYGEGRGIPIYGLLRRTAVACVIPPLAGYGVWMMVAHWVPRGIRFPAGGGYVPPDSSTPIFFSVSELIWRSVGLVVAIIVVLVALAWIDKNLRKRKAGNIPIDEAMGTTGGVYEVKDKEPDDLVEESITGAREKVLIAFRQFSEALTKQSLSRKSDETAPGYFERIQHSLDYLKKLGADTAAPFEKACYSQEEITDKEADLFQHNLEEKLDLIQTNPFEKPEEDSPDAQ